ncbi:MAG: type II 3-dehydroquinate dehydratase [Clostridia bacterium]|nr:type II 3-dehydroquinate dehydratase [Clostridia bacterium]
MKILVINGVNLNMLGIREPALYGKKDYKSLVGEIKAHAKEIGVKVTCVQSNYEGEIVEYIQRALAKYDGIVINPGAYTHTSVAILDALKAVDIPTVEVHLTDVDAREEYRKISYVSEYAFRRVTGKGFAGYLEALDAIKEKVGK